MLHLIWSQNGSLLRGWDSLTGVWCDGQVNQGVCFPGQVTQAQPIELSSSARNGTLETLSNLKLYLAGDAMDIAIMQATYPALGGGVEISFNRGLTYQTFSMTYGYEAVANTWILLPKESVGLLGVDGVLQPFESARFLIRYRIPANVDQFRAYSLRLEADFDVL